jgi:hypothetical protein
MLPPPRRSVSPQENVTPSESRPASAEMRKPMRSDFDDPPPAPGWRTRPPLQSTTYSIVPGAGERWSSAPPPSSIRAPRKVTPAPASVEPVVSTDDGELSPAQRHEIDAMYASLASLNHYELLGTARDASSAVLKANYEELARLFAPQRFARKQLGTYQRKLELILARVNEACSTLGDPERRARYDVRFNKRVG